MKSLHAIFIFSLILLCGTSCFEVTEEIDMNSDGSGKITLTINLSESRRSLVNYMKMKEVDGMRVPSREEMEADLDRVLQKMQQIAGLSEVTMKRDFDRFIFVLTSQFTDVKVLNKAIDEIAEVLNKSAYPTIETSSFEYSEKQFSRYFNPDIAHTRAEVYEQAGLTTRYMMDTARLISIFRFPKPIKTISNKTASLSPSKKSVLLRASIAELAKGEVILDNTVSF